jgi:hypothetical protein
MVENKYSQKTDILIPKSETAKTAKTDRHI